jgi:ribosomal protein S18 acetylase RimI-like enzyme
MEDSIIIRKATKEDIDRIADLLVSLFSNELELKPNKELHKIALEMILSDKNIGVIFVLAKDQYIIGTISILFSISTALGGKVGILEDFIIDEKYRKMSYGKKLYDYVIEYCKNEKLKRITLLTEYRNQNAQIFYSKNGFYKSPMIVMRTIL